MVDININSFQQLTNIPTNIYLSLTIETQAKGVKHVQS